ncbi:GNAT family N-acetyltransferase [Candidatus Peregrinibacteria bacterium]|nr:MAG: GNAT family N-acetyltransferase [Candidatus Peregrinibacteria bacterium]
MKATSAKPKLHIRQMEFEDLEKVFRLGERLFTAEKWPSLYRTWDEYEPISLFMTDGDFCWVAETDGKLVGFILGTIINKRRSSWRYGHVIWQGVEEGYKRQKIGSRLLNHLTKILIEHDVRMLLIDTDPNNETAVKFFKKHGFENEVEHVYMTKNLTDHPHYIKRSLTDQ